MRVGRRARDEIALNMSHSTLHEPLLEAVPKRRPSWLLIAATFSAVFFCTTTGTLLKELRLAQFELDELRGTVVAGATALAAVESTDNRVPRTKRIFERFDVLFHHQGDTASLSWKDKPAWERAWDPFFVQNFTYEFVHPYPITYGFSGWFEGEHTAYNTAFAGYNSSVFIAAASGDSLTCAAFHLATWAGPFAGVPAPSPAIKVHIKDLDFYAFSGDHIVTNWCMVDVVDVLRQGGIDVLPTHSSPLVDDGLYPPPRAVDGLPAPNSIFAEPALLARRQKLEALFRQTLHSDYVAQDRRVAGWARGAAWYGPGGIGRASSRADYAENFLAPLHAGLRSPRLLLNLLLCEAQYCGAHFRLVAAHEGSWLSMPPTARTMTITVGMHVRFAVGAEATRECDADRAAVGCIVEAWAQIDVLGAFASVGVDLLAAVRRDVA